MIISILEQAALSVGIDAVISNSREEIDTQVNKMMREGDAPKMLISWDMDVNVTFDENGFLNNPSIKLVILLMAKSEDDGNASKLQTAEEMGGVYQRFGKALYDKLIPYSKQSVSPITDIGYVLTPLYGRGKHSGVIGRLTCITPVTRCDV